MDSLPLPKELINLIYEFDPTYRDIFNLALKQLKKEHKKRVEMNIIMNGLCVKFQDFCDDEEMYDLGLETIQFNIMEFFYEHLSI